MGIGDMLQAQQDAKDGARYRWLRENGVYNRSSCSWILPWGPQVDRDVDTAIASNRHRERGRLVPSAGGNKVK